MSDPTPRDPLTDQDGIPAEAPTTPAEEVLPTRENAPTHQEDSVLTDETTSVVEETQHSPEEPPIPPAATYRWTYVEQSAHASATTKSSRGVRIYAVALSAVFLISFVLLLAVLFLGDNGYKGILRPGVSAETSDEAIEGVEQAKHSVVVIETVTRTGGGSVGSGIVMTANGYIATNHHVVENAATIRVRFYDGVYADATVVGTSDTDDLAVIKVSRTDLIPATFAYSSDCYVGQTVYAIGTPASPEFAWTTTRGIISYKDRAVTLDDGSTISLLQTDANVNPGNSGGPLINEKGEVLGVVTMKLAEGYEGIGFAIPSDIAVLILEDLVEIHKNRPLLGISCVDVTGGIYYVRTETGITAIREDRIDSYDPSVVLHPEITGVLVLDVVKGMGADGCLRVGDIITAVQGQPVTNGTILSAIVNRYAAGDTVTLTVHRDGRLIPVDIVLSPNNDAP